ncbi:MAG: hypothetical protein KF799_02250 [Bdellovibrionales bacterium]|nr:hypothetical protein [Bdellovibrionales bacterium]
MTRFTLVALATALYLGVLGCSKEDPIPEVRDPIYKDLEARFNAHTKKVEELDKAVEDLKKDLAKTDPNTLEKKDVQRDIAKNRAQRAEADQWARYYRIRTERRKFEARQDYKKAFAKGEEWPNPREYSDYQVNRRLVEAPRNWAMRVPKLVDRTAASVKATQGGHEKKTAEGSAPAGH